eukprot:3850741-Prymnesium_polylepis.2
MAGPTRTHTVRVVRVPWVPRCETCHSRRQKRRSCSPALGSAVVCGPNRVVSGGRDQHSGPATGQITQATTYNYKHVHVPPHFRFRGRKRVPPGGRFRGPPKAPSPISTAGGA